MCTRFKYVIGILWSPWCDARIGKLILLPSCRLAFVFSPFTDNGMPITTHKSRRFNVNYLLENYDGQRIQRIGQTKWKKNYMFSSIGLFVHQCLSMLMEFTGCCFVMDNWYHPNHIEQNRHKKKYRRTQTNFNQIQRSFFSYSLHLIHDVDFQCCLGRCACVCVARPAIMLMIQRRV